MVTPDLAPVVGMLFGALTLLRCWQFFKVFI